MTRQLLLLLFLLTQLFASLLAGTGDAPAATLLVPYFEVDLGCGSGASNTILTIENTGADLTIVQVTL